MATLHPILHLRVYPTPLLLPIMHPRLTRQTPPWPSLLAAPPLLSPLDAARRGNRVGNTATTVGVGVHGAASRWERVGRVSNHVCWWLTLPATCCPRSARFRPSEPFLLDHKSPPPPFNTLPRANGHASRHHLSTRSPGRQTRTPPPPFNTHQGRQTRRPSVLEKVPRGQGAYFLHTSGPISVACHISRAHKSKLGGQLASNPCSKCCILSRPRPQVGILPFLSRVAQASPIQAELCAIGCTHSHTAAKATASGCTSPQPTSWRW